ncbi:hypothetical protein [Williamwhitmania taraxaci]|uniref:Uncharacterized protein n=1 Tax=Williamwhitmania taraxaci TaxID=1640674 RepID=A0A1G6JC10_9BACT|nr:hypothetical protein [Williamwhitmania taraxaci]SDC16281.1 hypothetical protein SAMN05216323_101941 [Williamwhitmania taraxaci]
MKRISILMFAAGAMLFASCQKDDETTDPMVTTIQEDDLATNYYDDVDNEADEVTMEAPTRSLASSEMDIVADNGRTVTTIVNADNSITKTITFTNWTNPKGNQNIVKNGKIIINVVGRPIEDVFMRTITFENFTINGNRIEGTKMITKTAANQFTATCDNGKITFTDGKTYTRTFTRTRTWVDGFDTPYNVWDDVFEVTGGATGINRNGYVYTHTIMNPLRVERACRFIVSGTVEMLVNEKTVILDYGSGTCDNLATITYNGKTTEIKLRGGK